MTGEAGPVRWAVLGPGRIAESFVAGLRETRTGVLAGIGSSDPNRARAVADRLGAQHAGRYDDMIGRDDVDAVYVSSIHPAHLELAEAALRAGRAVLCEKPLTLTAADTAHLIATATAVGVPLVEAYKNRFSPFARALESAVALGGIGGGLRLRASFGFRAEPREGRLFDPALGGGALLDVGGYPLALAVQVAEAAGVALGALRIGDVAGRIGPTGVDEHARAVVIAPGFTAHVETSIRSELPRSAEVVGDRGRVVLPDAWGSRLASAGELRIVDDAGERVERPAVVNPFAAEADAVAELLVRGEIESPAMPWAHSIAVARLLDDWAAALRHA
ncbi:Gfo/Idh/MocA family protein [Microbacterium oleivorans]|uniref:Gfo/Idh/MocA family oxidoreductase n=1 Tax=Microbacterium oleivorans TaxID=273677 RepID=A0A7D5F5R2_9MICO|nr:Gfo/Idh/MocA family oxidoreductase [Microbacterium oleivorans]QLD12387.1 Gfo/Idh/MocA family oxidoreductase [Microbacterium oleivorans]